jgi:asparaginyl-tRNA synthetase
MKLENLRENPHLRIRTSTISSIMRIRNSLAMATHNFFQSRGFLYIHTPIITSSDCEGAGEMFQVTNMLKKLSTQDKIDKTKDYFKEVCNPLI